MGHYKHQGKSIDMSRMGDGKRGGGRHLKAMSWRRASLRFGPAKSSHEVHIWPLIHIVIYPLFSASLKLDSEVYSFPPILPAAIPAPESIRINAVRQGSIRGTAWWGHELEKQQSVACHFLSIAIAPYPLFHTPSTVTFPQFFSLFTTCIAW